MPGKLKTLPLVQRNRIARDIHNSLGHALTALNVQLQTTVKLWKIEPDKAQMFLKQAHHVVTMAMKEVHKSVSTLHADAQENQPPEAAIASLMTDFRISIFSSITLDVLPPQVVKTLYRIV